MEKEKNKHCAAPFRSIYLNDGIASPCCWYNRKSLKNNNQTLKTIKDTFFSEEFNEIRRNMYKETPPDECKKCTLHEKNGGKSHRMFWNERERTEWKGLDKTPLLKGVDLDMGNLCNLKCITCNTHNSSAWKEEEKVLFNKPFSEYEKKFDFNQLNNEVFKDISWLKLAGGEVLLMPEHQILLDYLIDNNFSKNIQLIYVVNNSISPLKFVKKWNQFKSIRIILSLDGINETHNYIRYPSHWDKNKIVIDEYLKLNVELEVNSVVSLYNIFHLKQLHQWWLDNGNDNPIFYRILTAPKYMSIVNLPESLKRRAIDNIKDIESFSHIVKALNKKNLESSLEFNNFLNFTDKIDKLRNLDFFKINPEFLSFKKSS